MQRKWVVVIAGCALALLVAALLTDNPPSDPPHAPEEGFRFTRSEFDDGWVAVVRPKWVEASKGEITALLHYPVDVKAANTDPDVMATAAWNALVSPRYENLRNYRTLGSVLNYERPYLAQGDVTETASGQLRFVALFSQGDSGWIEIVGSSREAFLEAFSVDAERINADRWGASDQALKNLRRLTVYNKFAVAASDLAGKWSSQFAANTFYVERRTGRNAGMSTYSSAEEYEFAGTRYTWRLAAANSGGGQTKFANAKAEGTFSLPDNWSVHFSDIEGRPRTYPVRFLAVEGGRALVIGDTRFVRVDR